MSHSHSHLGDPAIKLFGRNIPFPDSNIPATHPPMEECAETKKANEDDGVEESCESELEAKEKALKKPDKLVPCPRCNSSETKFCYFNNYNVNQPRHFCKNCHRYWTAGGTIRNVPVGAGRRRNSKHSTSRPANPDTLTSDDNNNSPLCESMETKLNLKDPKRTEPGTPTTFVDSFCEEPVSASSCSSAPECGNEDNNIAENPNPVQCYPVPQWPYPWNPAWSSMPVMTIPGFCPPNVPFQFVPGSYWGYMPGWEPGKWVSPVLGPTGSVSPTCSGNNSPTLGKHLREEGSKAEEESTEKCLWVPKTLRIDDPNEAAKSSIWSTLGIEPDRNKGFVKSGIFKPFKQKSDTNSDETDPDQVLQSNPAALSRSHSFQEST